MEYRRRNYENCHGTVLKRFWLAAPSHVQSHPREVIPVERDNFCLHMFTANSIPLIHHQEECGSNHCPAWQGPAPGCEKRQPGAS